jgi:colicin import membrane protein
VIALLVVSFRIVRRDEVPAPVMQAVVIREPSPGTPEQEKEKQELQRKKREADIQRAAEERQRKEAERVRLETERKQQEAEKKQQEEAQRQQQIAQEEKQRRDEERKKADKQRQQQAEQALRDQLADEEKNRVSVRAARLAPDADKYRAAIRQKVSRNWVRPPASRKDLQCTVRVRQAPGGEVLEAKVVRSSGDATFDRSVENAVFKASPLPAPQNPDVFDRDIEFIFRPEAESG